MKLFRYALIGVFTAVLTGCYTIVNQPSVLPADLRAQIRSDSLSSAANVTNNYYYYDGLYYNRPYYADRRYMRYDWFTGTYYYDPYFYNYNYFYDDTRWYYYAPYYSNHPVYNSGGSTVNTEPQERREHSFSRDRYTPPPPSSQQELPGYVVSPPPPSSSSTSTSTPAKTTTSESSTESSSNGNKRPSKRKR